jgi:hypothetical protein
MNQDLCYDIHVYGHVIVQAVKRRLRSAESGVQLRVQHVSGTSLQRCHHFVLVLFLQSYKPPEMVSCFIQLSLCFLFEVLSMEDY